MSKYLSFSSYLAVVQGLSALTASPLASAQSGCSIFMIQRVKFTKSVTLLK